MYFYEVFYNSYKKNIFILNTYYEWARLSKTSITSKKKKKIERNA